MKDPRKPLTSKEIEKKLKIAEDLFNIAYKAKSFQLKKKYPHWSNEQIHQRTVQLIDQGCA